MEPLTPPAPVPSRRRGPSLPLLAAVAVVALVVLWPRLAPAPPAVPDERPVVLAASTPAPTGARGRSVRRPEAPVDPAVAAAREPAPGAGLELQDDLPAADRAAARRAQERRARRRARARRARERRRRETAAARRAAQQAAPPAAIAPARAAPVRPWIPPRRRHDGSLLP